MKIQTISDWLNETLSTSKNDWMIVVFKVGGDFVDNSGRKRQINNSLSLNKFIRSVDWTILDLRRRLKSDMKFVSFFGGNEETQVQTHIHSFLEIPKSTNYEFIEKTLTENFDIYSKRNFKTNVESSVWTDRLDMNNYRSHVYYCSRSEGKTFKYGNEKVILSKSCLL